MIKRATNAQMRGLCVTSHARERVDALLEALLHDLCRLLPLELLVPGVEVAAFARPHHVEARRQRPRHEVGVLLHARTRAGAQRDTTSGHRARARSAHGRQTTQRSTTTRARSGLPHQSRLTDPQTVPKRSTSYPPRDSKSLLYSAMMPKPYSCHLPVRAGQFRPQKAQRKGTRTSAEHNTESSENRHIGQRRAHTKARTRGWFVVERRGRRALREADGSVHGAAAQCRQPYSRDEVGGKHHVHVLATNSDSNHQPKHDDNMKSLCSCAPS